MTAPVASAGGPYTVASGGTVTLAGSATGTTPMTFAWTASAGTLSDPTIANPVYTAPIVATTTTVNLSLTATNSVGSNTATTTVTVNAAGAPTANAVTPISLFSGQPGSIAVTGSDPNVPALPLTFTATQTGTPALLNLAVTSTGNTTANVTFTAPSLAPGTVTPAVITLTITAKNSAGVSSAPVITTVTVNPLADSITISIAQYRTGKQRLDMTATSTVISPNVVLTLQPYITAQGTLFTPTGATFTNTGGGIYTITLVGVPEPAIPPAKPLTVKSNLGGTSPATALTNIRQ